MQVSQKFCSILAVGNTRWSLRMVTDWKQVFVRNLFFFPVEGFFSESLCWEEKQIQIVKKAVKRPRRTEIGNSILSTNLSRRKAGGYLEGIKMEKKQKWKACDIHCSKQGLVIKGPIGAGLRYWVARLLRQRGHVWMEAAISMGEQSQNRLPRLPIETCRLFISSFSPFLYSPTSADCHPHAKVTASLGCDFPVLVSRQQIAIVASWFFSGWFGSEFISLNCPEQPKETKFTCQLNSFSTSHVFMLQKRTTQ